MKGDNHEFALTTVYVEETEEVKPLFSFPIQICKALDDPAKIASFDTAGPSGAVVKQQLVDTGTGEIIEAADKVKGVRLGDTFKPIDGEAIKAVEEATKVKTMYALGKLTLADFRARYGDRVNSRYFVQIPAKSGQAAYYKLVYEALLADGNCIVTKRTPTTRQQLGVIYADADNECLMYLSVVFSAIVRQPDEAVKAFATAKVTEKMVDQAKALIAGMVDGTSALDNEQDDAVEQRVKLIEQAAAGVAITAPEQPVVTNTTEDLASILEASLAAA